MKPMSLEKLVPQYIRQFEAYVPSKPDPELQKLYGCNRIYRLNNNENGLGPPPASQQIIQSFPPPAAALYPSGDCYYLRRALAEKFQKHPDRFIVGNGVNEVVACVIKAFCRQGDNIITADKTYAVYEWVARYSGCEVKLIPLKDFGFDAQAMLASADHRTKVFFLCNPNNPTGSYWNQDRMRRFLDAVDGRQIVVTDEAYFEFVDRPDYPDGMSLMDEYPNLIVFRTFSKMYGLAGLRVGYLAGSLEVVQMIRKTLTVYSVNTLAQETARAALADEGHVHRTRRMVRRGKAFLTRELSRLNLPVVAGEGNFMMVKLPMSDTLAYRKLMGEGVMVRTMTGFRFPNYIRVTISHMEAMQAFTEALAKILR